MPLIWDSNLPLIKEIVTEPGLDSRCFDFKMRRAKTTTKYFPTSQQKILDKQGVILRHLNNLIVWIYFYSSLRISYWLSNQKFSISSQYTNIIQGKKIKCVFSCGGISQPWLLYLDRTCFFVLDLLFYFRTDSFSPLKLRVSNQK